MIIASNEVKQLVLDRQATDRLDRRTLLSIVCAATRPFVLAAIAFLTGSVWPGAADASRIVIFGLESAR